MSRSSSGCSGMQSIYAQLTGGPYAFYIYICIVLDLAVGLTVCRASMLNWLGVHMPSIYIYMHCTRSSSGFNSMQGNYAELTGGSICLLYICIVLYLAVCVALCKASMLDWLGVSICLLYICIVLYLAVGVVVWKEYLLDWLGSPSTFYIYVLC